jgi:hypothetical protein
MTLQKDIKGLSHEMEWTEFGNKEMYKVFIKFKAIS